MKLMEDLEAEKCIWSLTIFFPVQKKFVVLRWYGFQNEKRILPEPMSFQSLENDKPNNLLIDFWKLLWICFSPFF